MKKSRRQARRGTVDWLGRYRFESAAVLGIAIAVAALLLYTPRKEQPEVGPTAAPTLIRLPTSTIIPQAAGPTAIPTYTVPRLTKDEAVELVRALPSYREPGRTIGDTVSDSWTAEYRGDGTWMVRAGEPAWLLLEDGNASMPANIAAINLQGASRGRTAR